MAVGTERRGGQEVPDLGINQEQSKDATQGLVRLSFAYVYEVVLDNKLLLVFNDNATAPKYQPLGGAYQCSDVAFNYLKRNYHLRSGQRASGDYEAPGTHDYRFLLPLAEVRPFLYDFLLGDLAPIEAADRCERQKIWQDMEAFGICAPSYLIDEPVDKALAALILCGIKHHCWSDRLTTLQRSWTWPYNSDLLAWGLRGPMRTWDELDALSQREYIFEARRELGEEIAATALFTRGEQSHLLGGDFYYRGRSYSVAFDYGFNCPSLMLTDCLRLSMTRKLEECFTMALERQEEAEYAAAGAWPLGFKPLCLLSAAEIEARMVPRFAQPSLDPNNPSCADHCRFILPSAPLHYPRSLEAY